MPCILMCRSFGGSPRPTTNPRDRVKKVEMTLCTFPLPLSSPCGAAKSLPDRGVETLRREKVRWAKHQIGREPHFFGFEPPKKFVGSLPPDTLVACRRFAACRKKRKRFVVRGPLQLIDEQDNNDWRFRGKPMKQPTISVPIWLKQNSKEPDNWPC
jgi:hypothetical protein